MNNSISATVSESFELTVSPSEGFTGEHNAEMLEINISPLIQGGYDYYVIVFDDMSVNGVKKSNEIRGSEDYPAYLDGETVFCPLAAQLTSTGKLRFQIEAHKLAATGSTIKKTSVASIDFKPSIMSGADSEFDATSVSRLDNLEAKMNEVESQIEELSIIPLATAENVGGIKLDADSPVQLDENGAATIDCSKINTTNTNAKLLIALMINDSRTKSLYVSNISEITDELEKLTQKVNLGSLRTAYFYSETAGNATYIDGNFETQTLSIKAGVIYVFTGQEADFKITEYNRYSFRRLLLEGVE